MDNFQLKVMSTNVIIIILHHSRSLQVMEIITLETNLSHEKQNKLAQLLYKTHMCYLDSETNQTNKISQSFCVCFRKVSHINTATIKHAHPLSNPSDSCHGTQCSNYYSVVFYRKKYQTIMIVCTMSYNIACLIDT